MTLRERLQAWRYNLVPDHVIGEILTKRWTDNAIPFLALVIVVAGGPRITQELARELGNDAGFGPGNYAEDVASFACHEWLRRHAHQREVQP